MVPVFFSVLALGIFIVVALHFVTNHMKPEWDMKYYLDMATNGLVGNKTLVAPFAYRPGAPLLVGTIARTLHLQPEITFRICDALMCVVFFLSCFYFAISEAATYKTAVFSSCVLALYFYIVKWTLFSGTMVDIYAYPLILLAFWAILRKRFYLGLLVSAVGLLFKEFLLVPLLTQATLLLIDRGQRRIRKVIIPVTATLVVLLVFFLLPRVLIHVSDTWQDIDPINRPSTLRRLYEYPANWRRDFNIVFAYLAFWLPVLLLVNTGRLRIVWSRLRPYKVTLALYMAFHFALVMYGGTNLIVFVTYSLPVQILVLIALLDGTKIGTWEKIWVLAVVIVFNRIWMHIPLPEHDLRTYLNFYGGYHMLVTRRSAFRMAELLAWISIFWVARYTIVESSSSLTSAGTLKS